MPQTHLYKDKNATSTPTTKINKLKKTLLFSLLLFPSSFCTF
jgi:hypothetical protein